MKLKLVLLICIGFLINIYANEKFELYSYNIKDIQNCNKLDKNKLVDCCKYKNTFILYYKKIENIILKWDVPHCKEKSKNLKDIDGIPIILIAVENPDIYTGHEFTVETCKTKDKIYYKVVNKI